MKKENKIKKLWDKYKEARKDPRKKAGMKLLGYFIFFFILMLIAGISNNISPKNNYSNITTTTSKVVDKYVLKQNKLLSEKYNIEYSIKYNNIDYKINGNLENNVVNGYLEYGNIIKKIIIKNNKIYEIYSSEEHELMVDFNINYINLEYILNIIKQNSAFIQDKDNIKTYLYEINNNDLLTKIYINVSEENINNIEITESNNSYNLKFDN